MSGPPLRLLLEGRSLFILYPIGISLPIRPGLINCGACSGSRVSCALSKVAARTGKLSAIAGSRGEPALRNDRCSTNAFCLAMDTSFDQPLSKHNEAQSSRHSQQLVDTLAAMRKNSHESLSCIGLFAGIGGIELGLSRAGHRTKMICEIDPGAIEVLSRRFKMGVELDVTQLGAFPTVDLIAAGFPCQDLSQAGRTAGIAGRQSGLVAEVFKRLRSRKNGPRWLLLENVPFMLQLQGGSGMRYLVSELEELGFSWAYRVIDSRAFGLPQRRRRVVLLASRSEDPRPVLFGSDAGEPAISSFHQQMCGFYWTEGRTGLGWAIDALPTLKGGSTLGIPSPPAIWDPKDGSISTPDIRDAERLQGFYANWTGPAAEISGVRQGHRWKLVGNAVSVPLAEWIGHRLVKHSAYVRSEIRLHPGSPWPRAAWGHRGSVYAVDVSMYPVLKQSKGLRDFLRYPRKPLSHRASSGFLSRTDRGSLNFNPDFIVDLKRHVRQMERCISD